MNSDTSCAQFDARPREHRVGLMHAKMQGDCGSHPKNDPSQSRRTYITRAPCLDTYLLTHLVKDLTMEHLAQRVAAYIIEDYPNILTQLPCDLETFYTQLVSVNAVNNTALAKSALNYLSQTLSSSVTIEEEGTCGSFLILCNPEGLRAWLASVTSAQVPSGSMRRSSDSDLELVDSSLESWASSTVTSTDDSEALMDNDGKMQSTFYAQLDEMLFGCSATVALRTQLDDLLNQQSYKEASSAKASIKATLESHMNICYCGEPGNCPDTDAVHFEKNITSTTDASLGDCSYLDTCFKGRGCKYVHYKMRLPTVKSLLIPQASARSQECVPPSQHIQCDLKELNFKNFGNDYGVIIVDPPWDIHINNGTTKPGTLVSDTLRDDDIAKLKIRHLQEDGVLFLWVTGRALDAGRNCLRQWGYTHTEELLWVKTNQLGRTIGTGRTGHWLNHTKEHVLVGVKGNPSFLRRQLDVDVLVSTARGNSQKPSELYGIIDRMVGNNTRKLELFGRKNNLRPGWITLGSELDGVNLSDPILKYRWSQAK